MAGGHPSSFLALIAPVGPWRDALVGTLPPRVRALHPADVHVTLAFLSGISPERARTAFDAAAALPLAAMDARLGKIVPLGPEGRWTALSVLLEDAADVIAAMRAVQPVAAQAAQIPEETRAPLPHVTLARLHAKASDEERAAAVRWAEAARPAGTLRLDRLALYTGRKHKEPGAAAYEVVAEVPLATGGARV